MSDLRRAKLTSYTDIAEERVTWLWPLRVPLGAVTLIAGQPGLGKSQVSLALAARLTRGELQCGRGTAIIGTAEDHRAAVIRPRLRAAQAELDAIFDIRVTRLNEEASEEGLVLPIDVGELEASIEETQARLVILDPLVSFLDGSVDSWKDASVRQALSPLAGVAERQGCAILGVVHVNKGLSGDPFQRIGGSVGFQGAPRSVLVLGRDPDDPNRRVLIHSKSNYGREAPSLLFEIEQILLPAADGAPQIETSRVVEIGETDHTAESVLGPALGDEERAGVDEAEQFLRDVLADGPVDAAQVKRDAKAAGISDRTLDRAKGALGIRMPDCVKRVGGVGERGHWTWELPKSAVPTTPLGALSQNPHEHEESPPSEPLRTPPRSNGSLSDAPQLPTSERERAALRDRLAREALVRGDAERYAADQQLDLATAPLDEIRKAYEA